MSRLDSVVIYSDTFIPSIGGGEIYVRDLAFGLWKKGIHTTVLTPYPNRGNDDFPFEVVRLGFSLRFGNFNLNFLNVLKAISKIKPSLFVINGPTPVEAPLLSALYILHIPTIITYHGQYNSKITKLAFHFYSKLYNLASLVLTQTNRDYEHLLKLGVKPRNLSHFRFTGVDRKKFNCNKKRETDSSIQLVDSTPLKCLYVGGISKTRPYKGFDLLIDAFNELDKIGYGEKIVLNMAGKGDLLNEMKLRVRNRKQINFLGFLAEDDLLSLICDADLLILPSKTAGEGFGKVVLEAISCGLPVMASEYAGSSEILKEYNAGFLYNPNNKSEIIELLTKIQKEKTLLTNIRKNAYRMIEQENLDSEMVLDLTISLYEKAINRQI